MYTVLHIEQSEFFRKNLKNLLMEKGYSYFAVENFDEAYEILMQNKINLIITSLAEEGDSLENFIRTINKSGKRDIPIFVVTGNKLDEAKRKLLNMGISDYILKENFFTEITKHIDLVFSEDTLLSKLRHAKIAVVDDSPFELQIQSEIFKKNKMENIDYYTTGEELLNSGKKYDIYIVDIVLKNEYGINVIMQLRRNDINSSIIAVSSLDNPKTIVSILNAGANDYIAKPFYEALYIARLKNMVR